jgi:hypothetical protein
MGPACILSQRYENTIGVIPAAQETLETGKDKYCTHAGIHKNKSDRVGTRMLECLVRLSGGFPRCILTSSSTKNKPLWI